jgi:geranylgeranyl pyrophosphate synthase
MSPSRPNQIQVSTALDALYQREMPQSDSSLFQAARYHFQNPGKSFRAQLALTTGLALGFKRAR